jgi:hypothetical protein
MSAITQRPAARIPRLIAGSWPRRVVFYLPVLAL